MSCSHYVANRDQAAGAPQDNAEARGFPYDDSYFNQTLFEVIYAFSPPGRSLHSQFIKSTSHELEGRIPFGNRSTGDEANMAVREIADTALPLYSQDRTRLDGGLGRYYGLENESSEWKATRRDDRDVRQLKLQRDEVDTPDDATTVPNGAPMSSDDDSATNCTMASGMLERNQAAIEENREDWMPKDGVISDDLLCRFIHNGQPEPGEVCDSDAEDGSGAERSPGDLAVNHS
ncbi:hypothetical protein PG996_008960 [Apiospora saccharicola]|uniref:Uncharacterized protein n=1 Tax=Apiospora saccharicola TaxID=335842 RepID=A0ABR1V2S4_9PEZI